MSETVATARRYKTHWFSKGQVYLKLWRGRGEDQKIRLVILKMHKMDRVQIRPKPVERFMVSSLPLFLVNLIFYAWFNLTCYHASQAYPLGFSIFFSRGVILPAPGTQKETNPHPRTPDRPHIRFLGTSFWEQYWFLCNRKTRGLQKFYESVYKCILEFMERRKIQVKCS